MRGRWMGALVLHQSGLMLVALVWSSLPLVPDSVQLRHDHLARKHRELLATMIFGQPEARGISPTRSKTPVPLPEQIFISRPGAGDLKRGKGD